MAMEVERERVGKSTINGPFSIAMLQKMRTECWFYKHKRGLNMIEPSKQYKNVNLINKQLGLNMIDTSNIGMRRSHVAIWLWSNFGASGDQTWPIGRVMEPMMVTTDHWGRFFLNPEVSICCIEILAHAWFHTGLGSP